MPIEATERDLTVNGLRLHLLEWDGGGPHTLLCLHGFLDLAWSWQAVAPRLAAAGLHVVAPDLRGHGDSDRVGPGGFYHFMDHVLDAADLAESVARDQLSLCGHSIGAMIASYVAGSLPERVHRLAVLDGFGGRDEPVDLAARRAADWIQAVRQTRAPVADPNVEAAAAQFRGIDEAIFASLRGVCTACRSCLTGAIHRCSPSPRGRAFLLPEDQQTRCAGTKTEQHEENPRFLGTLQPQRPRGWAQRNIPLRISLCQLDRQHFFSFHGVDSHLS